MTLYSEDYYPPHFTVGETEAQEDLSRSYRSTSKGQTQDANTCLLSPSPCLSRIVQILFSMCALSTIILFWQIVSLALICWDSHECQEQTNHPIPTLRTWPAIGQSPKALSLVLVSPASEEIHVGPAHASYSLSMESVCFDFFLSPTSFRSPFKAASHVVLHLYLLRMEQDNIITPCASVR